MITCGILCATEKELSPYLQDIKHTHITKTAMLSFHQGIFNNITTVAVCAGVGKINTAIAAQILIDKFQVNCIIVSGIAGGMAPNVNVFDTVVCTEMVCHDTNNEIYTECHPWMKEAKFYADTELIKLSKIAAIRVPQHVHFGLSTTGEISINLGKTTALCIEMENAPVAHVCYVNQIPFIAIRSISDNKKENGQEAIDRNFDKASFQSYIFVKELMNILPY